jgi:hypothetical protein
MSISRSPRIENCKFMPPHYVCGKSRARTSLRDTARLHGGNWRLRGLPRFGHVHDDGECQTSNAGFMDDWGCVAGSQPRLKVSAHTAPPRAAIALHRQGADAGLMAMQVKWSETCWESAMIFNRKATTAIFVRLRAGLRREARHNGPRPSRDGLQTGPNTPSEQRPCD